MYQQIDAGMIRMSVFPLTSTTPSWPGESATLEQIRTWLKEVWADVPRAEAIGHAAPLLTSAVRTAIDGTARPARLRRTGRAAARYLVRMRYRATPFGLFAGSTTVSFGQEAHVHRGSRHRAYACADATWLHEITAALEHDPAVLPRLTVVTDPTCTVRGARIVVAHQPGTDGPTDTSLRRTRAAETALGIARSPVQVRDLVDKLHAGYPDTPKPVVQEMVRDLVSHRVLLTGLQPPMTCTDTLGHLIARLDEAGATTRTAQLRPIQRLLHLHDHASTEDQPRLRAEAAEAMTAITRGTASPLMVNVRPDCDVVLPDEVAREAERALAVMARITPYPQGSPAWSDYRARFLERYSMGSVVPVRELTDPDTGLGFPVGFRGTVLPRPVLATTPRDEHLLALAQDAALTDKREIVLTDGDMEALSLGEPAQVPAHVELCFSVLALSARALTEGRFNLSTVGLSLAAGTLTGRFLPMLEPAELAQVAAGYTALPTLTDGAVRTQISAPPLKRQTHNVGRAPLLAPEALSVGEHNPDATLGLDDLGVTADSAQLYLVSLLSGRIIEPTVMNAVELSTATHPLVRFLSELHRSHAAILIPFAWGAAARLPFLPEVRYGRTILSGACWRLHARDVTEPREWTKHFTNWRIRYGVPRTVTVGSDDKQLRLDLDLAADRDLLRAEVDRHGTVVLHEAPEESAFGWIGHAHEVTVPFAANQQPVPHPTRGATYVREAARIPGSTDWAYLKVYGSEARVPDVLTAHLPRLLAELENITESWFIRYADPDAHLRVRLRLAATDAFGPVTREVAAWAAELSEEGLIHRVQWDTDQPETGRYGTGAALAAAETYFAADSTAALAQMRLAVPADLRPGVTAASFVDIASGLLGSRSAGRDWLIRHLPRSDAAPAPRPAQALALRLTDSDGPRAVLGGLAGGDAVGSTWTERREALARYRQALDAQGITPSTVLPSLLHMHHNRVAGIDLDAEATCRRTARAAALSWITRSQGVPR
ncbi:lantibiotic dehydratase [Streptomyces sp. CBMA29]|uniref:lantibiotic dehydratase n=1 Tax=Streptomyces sp. CBMA29 TaxID=1896314 RepID=UPI001CB6CDD4|nr:lantibiotic dehydratase [Streptomyces sp. CBMA29]MBD0737815.1 bacteriocin biosynthesis protein [Streptomyces sp. CBMA29]